MTKGVAVCDATSLIAFHQIDRLALIIELFARTVAPDIVAREVAPSRGMLPNWIEVREAPPLPIVPRSLDAWERAVIRLANASPLISPSWMTLQDEMQVLILA